MPTDIGLSLLDEEAGSHECSACVWREQSKVLRLETIKSQILSKLRLKQAPNISREVVNQLLPKAPPLQQLLDHHDFQGDASSQDEFMEEDEYHATTESVITMASEREYKYNFIVTIYINLHQGKSNSLPCVGMMT